MYILVIKNTFTEKYFVLPSNNSTLNLYVKQDKHSEVKNFILRGSINHCKDLKKGKILRFCEFGLCISESWVDIDTRSVCSQGGGTPGSLSIMQQLDAENLRLLREAQRESNQSSARVSLAGSRRDSPRSSPKSPPNSPVQGTPIIMDWHSYYMNSESRDVSRNSKVYMTK